MPRHVLWITLTAHPGTRDQLAACTLELAEKLQDDPGCELFVVSDSATDPDVLHLCEIYADAEVVPQILGRPDVQALVARSLPFIADRQADVGEPLTS